MQSGGETIDTTTRFTQFLSDWLEMMRASVESTTFSSYSMTIRNKVIPYFDKRFPKLKLIDVTEEEAAVVMAVVSHRSGIPLNRLQFNSIKAVPADGKDET